MSESYIITAKTKGKEPKVLFLSKEFNWAYSVTFARICSLSSAKDAAKDEPTHCLFVEATDELIDALQDINKVDYNEFWQFIERFGCKTVSTRKEKAKPETEAKPEVREEKRYYLYSKSADGKVKYFCSKDADKVALHKNQRVQIFTQREAHELQYLPYTDESDAEIWHVGDIGLWSENLGEAESEPQEKREYVLYRYLGDTGVIQFYFSYKAKDCYSKNLDTATLHTEDEANLQVNKLAHAGSKGWFCVHRDAFNADNSFKEAEQETPAPEAKKRVAHVLYSIGKIGEHKVYAHYKSDGIFVRVRGIIADAYRTPDGAQFAADVLNNNGDTNFGWQVEQIEF